MSYSLPVNWQWTSISQINDIASTEFAQLKPSSNVGDVFLYREFLAALEQSNSVGEKTGWIPSHIIITDEHELVAFLPAYIKHHSYGEYVFDHSWAHAYQQNGLAYYPKLSHCIPFTPVTGPRMLLKDGITPEQVIAFLGQHKKQIMQQLGVSSWHSLFVTEDVSKESVNHGFHLRQSVQFNWHNNAFDSFDDYLSILTARRRRSIKKERKGMHKQNVNIRRVVSHHITSEDLAFFYQCYQQTYLKRSGHHGYLTETFFMQLLNTMCGNMLLVIAHIDNKPVASALFLFNEHGLFGRYWGAIEEVSGLHFEVCYYQGIEFCIEQHIPFFNPGTQGEHKILRGFEPTLCYSCHSMLHDGFDQAVADFVEREAPHILEYHTQSSTLLPFNENHRRAN